MKCSKLTSTRRPSGDLVNPKPVSRQPIAGSQITWHRASNLHVNKCFALRDGERASSLPPAHVSSAGVVEGRRPWRRHRCHPWRHYSVLPTTRSQRRKFPYRGRTVYLLNRCILFLVARVSCFLIIKKQYNSSRGKTGLATTKYSVDNNVLLY